MQYSNCIVLTSIQDVGGVRRHCADGVVPDVDRALAGVAVVAALHRVLHLDLELVVVGGRAAELGVVDPDDGRAGVVVVADVQNETGTVYILEFIYLFILLFFKTHLGPV